MINEKINELYGEYIFDQSETLKNIIEKHKDFNNFNKEIVNQLQTEYNNDKLNIHVKAKKTYDESYNVNNDFSNIFSDNVVNIYKKWNMKKDTKYYKV